MLIKDNIPLLDDVLANFSSSLASDANGYRNHVYRMVNLCFAQGDLSDDEKRTIVIAGCFHDLGIWTEGTFDYIPPSRSLALEYLEQHDLADLAPQIEKMISEHHKLRPVDGDRLTEIFRRGDLADLSLGLVTNGIPRAYIREVRSHFPNAGFHKYLVRLAAGWIWRHPLRPVPVLKW